MGISVPKEEKKRERVEIEMVLTVKMFFAPRMFAACKNIVLIKTFLAKTGKCFPL